MAKDNPARVAAAMVSSRWLIWKDAGTVTTVRSASPDEHRQRLHKSALQWTAPVDEFTVFVSAIGSHRPRPPQPLLVVHLDESLYNRPPPSC